MHQKVNLMIARDRAVMAEMMLDIFMRLVKKSLQKSSRFYMAIPGGRTPRAFFELLARDEKARALNWDALHIFWTDERCVPPDSQESNYNLAYESFLTQVPLPADNIHRIGGENPDPFFEADLYEGIIKQTLKTAFGQIPEFDLIILGMGDDGHIASLFPGSEVEHETQEMVAATDRDYVGFQRITLTAPVLTSARKIVVMVAGDDKQDRIAEIFNTPSMEIFQYAYPVHHLWPVLDKVTWLLDKEAAEKLEL